MNQHETFILEERLRPESTYGEVNKHEAKSCTRGGSRINWHEKMEAKRDEDETQHQSTEHPLVSLGLKLPPTPLKSRISQSSNQALSLYTSEIWP